MTSTAASGIHFRGTVEHPDRSRRNSSRSEAVTPPDQSPEPMRPVGIIERKRLSRQREKGGFLSLFGLIRLFILRHRRGIICHIYTRKQGRGVPEQQEEANKRRDAFEITVRLNANFTHRDYYITLTYSKDKQPETVNDAKTDRAAFLRRVRSIYERHGLRPLYLICTEVGKRGGIHHHLVIDGRVDVREICEAWSLGHNNIELLEPSGEYSRLAEYFVKNRKQWKAAGGTGRMWTCSRYIQRPPTVKRIVNANRYTETPRERKGFRIDRDTIKRGITRDGWSYLSYICIEENQTDERRQRYRHTDEDQRPEPMRLLRRSRSRPPTKTKTATVRGNHGSGNRKEL